MYKRQGLFCPSFESRTARSISSVECRRTVWARVSAGPVTGVGSEVEIESPPILTLLGANGNKSIRLGSFGAT